MGKLLATVSNKYFLHQLLIVLLPVQLGLHLWPQWAFVHGIRVDYLSPTIYLTDVLIFLIVIPWIIKNYQHVKPFWFYGMLAIVAINLIFSVRIEVSLYKWIKFSEIFLYALFVAKEKKIDFQKHLLAPLSYSLILISLVGIAQFLLQKNIGGLFYFLGERTFGPLTPGIALFSLFGEHKLRAYSIFSHPNSFAGYLLVATSLVVLYSKKNLLKFAVVSTAFFGILFSFSKAVFVLTPTLFLVSKVEKTTVERALAILFWGVVVVSIIALFLTPSLFNITAAETYVDRIELIKLSKDIFFDYPVFGVGLGNFVSVLTDYDSQTGSIWKLQPVHNIFLLVLTEVGIVGLIVFVLLLWQFFKSEVTSNYKILLPITLIVLSGFVDHYWLTLQQNQLLFALVLGLSYKKFE